MKNSTLPPGYSIAELIDPAQIIAALTNCNTPQELAAIRSQYPRELLNCAKQNLSKQHRAKINSLLAHPDSKAVSPNRLVFAYIAAPEPAPMPMPMPIPMPTSSLIPARFWDADTVALDTETTGLDPLLHKVRLVQFAIDGAEPLVLDLWGLGDEQTAELRRYLQSDRRWVLHNSKFDWKQIQQSLGVELGGKIFDTMIAATLIEAGKRQGKYGLEHVAHRYLGLVLDKTEQRSDWSSPNLTPAQLQYAAEDAANTLALHKVLAQNLTERGLDEVAAIEFGCVPALCEMELTGMLLDLEAWGQLTAAKRVERDRLHGEIQTLFTPHAPLCQGDLFGGTADAVNLDSPQQLQAALGWLGVRLEGTGKDVLSQATGDHPVVGLLLEYRKLQKFLSAFGDALPKQVHPKTGRIHADFRQLGSDAGRMSCSDPNLQQIPRDKVYRACFVPREGFRYAICDYGQMELRLAAEISGDRVMTQAYQDGTDLHTLTASLITGKALGDVAKADRQVAKSLNFGLLYGMGSAGLQAYARANYQVNLTLDQAEEFRDKFFKAYPGLARWHQRTGNTLRNLKPGEGYQTRTLAGRKRDFAEPKLTTALNTPTQGSGADVTKLALAKLKRRLAGFEAKIIGVVHDEIIVEVAAEQAEAVAAILSDCMVGAGETYLKAVPCEAEAAIGSSWADKG